MFVIGAHMATRIDRRNHDVNECWSIAVGTGTVMVGDEHQDVIDDANVNGLHTQPDRASKHIVAISVGLQLEGGSDV
jgi:hypothetical protein